MIWINDFNLIADYYAGMAVNEPSILNASLSELDVLVEQERISAEKIIQAAFQHEIHLALIRTSEINKINGARIVAAAQIASAKAATEAEVNSATLSALALTVLTNVKAKGRFGITHAPDSNAVIKAACDVATVEVSNHAADAIKAIELEAKRAIDQIREIGQSAIQEIHTYVENTKKTIEANALTAQERLAALKSKPRLPADVRQYADEAAALLVIEYAKYSESLEEHVLGSTSEIKMTADGSISEINAAVSQAEERIKASLDRARQLISEHAGRMIH